MLKEDIGKLNEEIVSLYSKNILPKLKEMKKTFFISFENFLKEQDFTVVRNEHTDRVTATYKKLEIVAEEDPDNEELIYIRNGDYENWKIQLRIKGLDGKIVRAYQENRKRVLDLYKEKDQKQVIINAYKQQEIEYAIEKDKGKGYDEYKRPKDILRYIFS